MDKYTKNVLNRLKDIGRVPIEDRKMKHRFRMFIHKLMGKEILIEDALMSFDWKLNENNEVSLVSDDETKKHS